MRWLSPAQASAKLLWLLHSSDHTGLAESQSPARKETGEPIFLEALDGRSCLGAASRKIADYHMVVSEPDPGRILQEEDVDDRICLSIYLAEAEAVRRG